MTKLNRVTVGAMVNFIRNCAAQLESFKKCHVFVEDRRKHNLLRSPWDVSMMPLCQCCSRVTNVVTCCPCAVVLDTDVVSSALLQLSVCLPRSLLMCMLAMLSPSLSRR
eukprot:953718-Amphidinium_carterae.1